MMTAGGAFGPVASVAPTRLARGWPDCRARQAGPARGSPRFSPSNRECHAAEKPFARGDDLALAKGFVVFDPTR